MSVKCICGVISVTFHQSLSWRLRMCYIHFFNRVDLPKLTYQGSFSVPVYHLHCYIHFIYPKNKAIRMPYTDGSCLYIVEGRNVKKIQRLYTRCQHWFKRREYFSEHRGHVWTSVHLHQSTNEQKRVNGTFDSYIICSLQTVDNKGCSVLFGKRDVFLCSFIICCCTPPPLACAVWIFPIEMQCPCFLIWRSESRAARCARLRLKRAHDCHHLLPYLEAS